MKSQSDKLSIREYIAITILMVGAKGTDETPSMLYNQVQYAAWMIPHIRRAVFYSTDSIIKGSLCLSGQKFIDRYSTIAGKYIGFVICLLIFLITSLAISYESRTYTNIINSFYFQTTPNLIIYGILMLVSSYGAKKGIRLIGSVSYLVIAYVLLSFSLALILSIQHSNINAIFPIWGPGKLRNFKRKHFKFFPFQ